MLTKFSIFANVRSKKFMEKAILDQSNQRLISSGPRKPKGKNVSIKKGVENAINPFSHKVEDSVNHQEGSSGMLSNPKLDAALSKMHEDRLITTDMVRNIFTCFVTGDPNSVPASLQQFMLASFTDNKVTLKWIPYYMTIIFRSFLTQFPPPPIFSILLVIVIMFESLLTEVDNGKAWEGLFIIALLARVGSCQFDPLLPLDKNSFQNCTVSFHEPEFSKIENVNDFVDSLQKPSSFPHVAIYYPKNWQRLGSFRYYNIIVAAYNEREEPSYFGYHLKEGEYYPQHPPCQKFQSCL